MSQVSIPQQSLEVLNEITRVTRMSLEELQTEYWMEYSDPFVLSDTQFKTDADRHSYISKVIKVKYFNAPPATEHVVIPIGVSEVRIASGSKEKFARIRALVRIQEKWQLSTIVLSGKEQVCLVNSHDQYSMYKTVLSGRGGDTFFAVPKTSFVNGKVIHDPYNVIIAKELQLRAIKIKDTPDNLSRLVEPKGKKSVDGKKYADENDLKIVEGIVVRYRRGTRADGTDQCTYSIGDGEYSEATVNSDGIIIPSVMTVWTPASLMKYGEKSHCYFLGTISLTKNEPQMNCISIIPILSRPIEEAK